MTNQASVAVVVSTVGRPVSLADLFASLSEQTRAPDRIVIVDQSLNADTQDVCTEWSSKLPIKWVASARGLSIGRNRGLLECKDIDIVAITDDDCSLTPRFLEIACSYFDEFPSVGAVSGRVCHKGGTARMAFPTAITSVNRRNVWSSTIEAAMVFRRSVIEAAGGYAEHIGAGSTSPWQSGEGTELLLRLLANGHDVYYDPRLAVIEDAPTGGYSTNDYLSKTRRYARGTGFVLRSTNCGTRTLLRALGGPCARSLKGLFRADIGSSSKAGHQLLGRLEGYFGRCLRDRS